MQDGICFRRRGVSSRGAAAACLLLVVAGQSITAEEKAMVPFWESGEMVGESVLVVGEPGQEAVVPLLFRPTGQVRVQPATLDREFTAGKDFNVDGDRLRFPANSGVPRLSTAELFPDRPPASGIRTFPAIDGGLLLSPEGTWFHQRQLAVSYHFDPQAWTGPRPSSCLKALPRTRRLLAAGKAMRMVYYGDSITVGANASGRGGQAPRQPIWADLVTAALEKQYGVSAETVNTSVGGRDSLWGQQQCASRCAAHRPDLAVIAFGMNGNHLPQTFAGHIRSIISQTRAVVPEAEFILVKAMLPNPKWHSVARKKAYWAELDAVAADTAGVAVADVGPVHEALLHTRRYYDLTGNHVNHPNDFLIRIHAQVLLALLSP